MRKLKRLKKSERGSYLRKKHHSKIILMTVVVWTMKKAILLQKLAKDLREVRPL